MLTRKHSIEGKDPFGTNTAVFEKLDAESVMKMALLTGDIILILDAEGTILDSAYDREYFGEFDDWIGMNWIETVTEESRFKVMEMLAAARRGELQHWRQVNHPTGSGDLAVRYVVQSVDEGRHRLAFGRDLRETARVQQRLLQVQQSLERDYMKMRQLEARYRTLFEASGEATLIVEAGTLRVREANPAAHRLLGAKAGSLGGKKILALLARESREVFQSFAGATLASESAAPIEITLGHGKQHVVAEASAFMQDRGRFLLLRLSQIYEDQSDNPSRARSPVLDLVEAMPDAFVVADANMKIVSANDAFIELAQEASVEQLRGRSLANWIGRPGIDLELIEAQIDQHGAARNVSTILRVGETTEDEPIEVSAVRSSGDEALFAFVIRAIGRRLRDLPPGAKDMPRSVEQLTDLVGRMPLKDIVRESTDLIERLCIEAALTYTSDNRASAAEILGLSRQSLYSKLHRHGLGNLPTDAD